MRLWKLKRMRPSLKDRILEGIAQSDARNLTNTMKEIVEKMTPADRCTAEAFLMWACQNEIALKAETIEFRFHEFKKKLTPRPEKEAADLWRAFNPNSSAEELLDIVLHRDADLRMYVAANPYAPVDVLNLLSVDKDEEVRHRVARNQSATAEILERLAKDKDSSVRQEVAKNYASPADALAELAGDTLWYIRSDVAEHPSTDGQTLARLACDREEYVRVRVARHPSTPSAVLAQLASDGEPMVRACVAQHPATPLEALDRLAQDPYEYIREAVTKNPGPPPPIQKSFHDLLREYEAAKKALLKYLDEKYPCGETIKTNFVEGTILTQSINSEGDPVLSIEKASGRLLQVKALELDDNSPDKPSRARDRSSSKK